MQRFLFEKEYTPNAEVEGIFERKPTALKTKKKVVLPRKASSILKEKNKAEGPTLLYLTFMLEEIQLSTKNPVWNSNLIQSYGWNHAWVGDSKIYLSPLSARFTFPAAYSASSRDISNLRLDRSLYFGLLHLHAITNSELYTLQSQREEVKLQYSMVDGSGSLFLEGRMSLCIC